MSPNPKKSAEKYIVFARKWRPQTFEEVVGQSAVKRQLQNALSEERIANAYLFAGPRGVGKTSMARILSKALNCKKGITPKPCNKCELCLSITQGSSMDVVEIEGASYTKVEHIRDLQEGINRASFSARKKVYIIDEVHMLSINAFNALLKTLEEPPAFVVFIFATTQIEKIPETIISRCQVYHFERIAMKDIIERLNLILSKEKGIKVSPDEKDDILEAIAAGSEGGMRDAEVALDQLISLSGGHLKFEHVSQLLGLVESDLLIGTVRDLAKKDVKALLDRVAGLVNQGRDLERFVKTFQAFLRDLLIMKAGGDIMLVDFSPERLKEIQELLPDLSLPFILNMMNNFLSLEERMKTSAHVRFHLEFILIKISVIQSDVDIEELLSRIENLPKGEGPPPGRAVPGVSTAPPPRPPATSDLFNGKATREDRPTPAAVAPLEGDELTDHSRIWERFKAAVAEKKHILEDVLDRCRRHDFRNKTLFVQCPPGYDEKMLTTRDSIQLMEKVLSSLLGEPGKVKVVLIRESPAVTTPQSAKAPLDSRREEETLTSEDETAVDENGLEIQDAPLPQEEQEESSLNVEKYRHLFKDDKVGKKFVHDLLKKNPDVKTAVELIKKTFDADMMHFDGKKIT